MTWARTHRRGLLAVAVLGALCAGGGLWVLRSAAGRAWLVAQSISALNRSLAGRGRFVLDSAPRVAATGVDLFGLTLRNPLGQEVLRVGRIRAAIAWRAVLAQRIRLSRLDVDSLVIRMTQTPDGRWDLVQILMGDAPVATSRRGLGDDVVADSIQMRAARITLDMPWEPPVGLTQRQRDSATVAHRTAHRTGLPGSADRVLRVMALDVVTAHDARLLQPAPQATRLALDELQGTISEPEVHIAGASGDVRWTSDSLLLRLTQVRLPHSQAQVVGAVSWGAPGPIRYDLRVDADAALADLQWIWPALPTDGRGRASVWARTIGSGDSAEYSLTNLDATGMQSRVTGRVSVVVRPLDLVLRGMSLSFAPLSVQLMQRLGDNALPSILRGAVAGRVVAERGGPLTAFRLDSLALQFTDPRVPRAMTRLDASGTVELGAVPALRDAQVRTLSLDMRQLRPLFPAAPAVDGTLAVRGALTLVRPDRIDLTAGTARWEDAAGHVSVLRGAVRVAQDAGTVRIKAAVLMDSVDLRALARVDTTLRSGGVLRGELVAEGTRDSLPWRLTLGPMDAQPIRGDGTVAQRDSVWRLTSRWTLTDADAQAWTAQADIPHTALSGDVALLAAGLRTATAFRVTEAKTRLQVAQPDGPARPAFSFALAGALDTARIHVDSAALLVDGATLVARGAIAMPATGAVGTDTLRVNLAADSLTALRRPLQRLAAMIAPTDSAGADRLGAIAEGTLHGDATLSAEFTGALPHPDVAVALGARAIAIGPVAMERVFGSVAATSIGKGTRIDAAATIDALSGLGPSRIASLEMRVDRATPTDGAMRLDAMSANNAHLQVTGRYARDSSALTVRMDTVRFTAGATLWQAPRPWRFVQTAAGLRSDSLELVGPRRGRVRVVADLPASAPIVATARLEAFPIGQAAELALDAPPFDGLLSGDITVQGTRAAPTLSWVLAVDSLGRKGLVLPRITSTATVATRVADFTAAIRDSLGGRLQITGRLPLEAGNTAPGSTAATASLDVAVMADALRLEALDVRVPGARQLTGTISGQLAAAGSIERPVFRGRLTGENLAVLLPDLGLTPTDGRVVLRATPDSLILESLRVRSGRPGDTLGVQGAITRGRGDSLQVTARVGLSDLVAARQRTGTTVVLGGDLDIAGPLRRPTVRGVLLVPRATLRIDPLAANAAIDLASAAATALLAPEEVPIAHGAGRVAVRVGDVLQIDTVRVALGSDVWVHTPEATVKLGGAVRVSTRDGEVVPDGDITANQGQYRLDLGIVNRSFRVDSGRVRFFGQARVPPALNINATNVVRVATGEEIPVTVRIGGTLDKPVTRLSSADPLYASAPESEIISLLIFGAPTFALDGQSQSTVKAVTGVLLPSVGGAVEGALQRLLPVFNTVQVTTAGGQSRDDLSAYSLLDNLSVSAGKQIGERTFLRLNTGVCRNTGQSASKAAVLWYGVAAEYRLARGLSAQMGVDPGASPCSRLGGDLFPRMQFGLDVFRDWTF